MFVWRGNISTYQCAFISIKSITLASNLDGINVIYFLLNGFTSLISVFIANDLLPINLNTLSSNLDGINHIFIFELMEFPYFHFCITSSSICVYTPILQMPCDVIYCCYEHMYSYINCSCLEPTNSYMLYVFNTGV